MLIIVGLAAALRVLCRKCEKKIADEETAQKIIAALEGESIKYETYFKLIIATGMRRGECCGLKWCDIDFPRRIFRKEMRMLLDKGDDVVVPLFGRPHLVY